MRHRPRAWLAALAAVALYASPAFAQNDPAPDAEATMRLGPLAMKSAFALSNLGIDTNVFNEAGADGPQSDTTMTFTPTTNLWLRMGRTWVSGTIDVDWVYYHRFKSERSANSTYTVDVSRALNRLALKGGASRVSTRDRPGFEIDARSQRAETAFDGEVTMRIFSKTRAGGRAWRRHVEFDQAAVFRDASLGQQLNRKSSGTAVTLRHDLTPLTSVSLEIGRDRERFVSSPFRDSDSTRVTANVTLRPLALISGDASFGYRRFTPLTGEVPPYRGGTAAVGLSYTVIGATRLGVEAIRDVQPSFERTQPYYLETGVTGSVQRQVYGPFDVLARAGVRRLAYRDRIGVVVRASDRTDRVRTFSLGAGYRLGLDKRIGFTLDHQERRSSVDEYQYSGLRFGMSVTYET